jgi:plasmid stabilization system protein ParE
MSLPVVLRPSAARDLADAHAYYSPHGKADDFMAALDRVIAHISERPHMYPIVYAEVHRALLRRFPFSVFFVIEVDRAVVLAVHHQRRDPASRPRP